MSRFVQTLVAVAVLLLLQFLITFEMNVIMPLAPIVAQLYGVAENQVTYLNLGYALSGLFAPFLGYLADRFGIKRMLIVSTLLFGLGTWLVSMQSSILFYVMGRTILGIGFYTLISISLSYFALLVSERKLGLMSGLYKFAFALAVFVSPLLGTWLVTTISFSVIYRFLSISALVLSILLCLAPSVKSESQHMTLKEGMSLFKDKVAINMMSATALLSIPSIFFFNFLSIYLFQQKMTPIVIGQLYSVIAIGSMIAAVLIMFVSDRIGKVNVMYTGLAMSVIFFASFSIQIIPLYFALGLMLGIGFDLIWGLLYPLGTRMYPAQSATFLTMLSLIMSMTNVISNAIGPWMFSLGGFQLLTMICSLGALLAFFLIKKSIHSTNLRNF